MKLGSSLPESLYVKKNSKVWIELVSKKTRSPKFPNKDAI